MAWNNYTYKVGWFKGHNFISKVQYSPFSNTMKLSVQYKMKHDNVEEDDLFLEDDNLEGYCAV
jgi:hypothetical protein